MKTFRYQEVLGSPNKEMNEELTRNIGNDEQIEEVAFVALSIS